jgi:ParB-like chromosome segregation protein Spo0J
MKMEIREIPIKDINPATYNPRIDLQPGDADYDKLAKSLEEFDLVEPLVWNEKTGNLVGGHQRLKIMEARGDKTATVSVVKLNVSKEKALNLALNKIGGDWDLPKLSTLLTELEVKLPDIEVTGFDNKEIRKLTAQFNQSMLPKGAPEGGDCEGIVITFTPEDFELIQKDLFELLERFDIEADIS